ncbi:hypothetical protein LNP27_05055 [Flavobacterium galactosidilyticum]|uniref:hypothetical protein n=1 Tax=Flavobacterium galactosidilyticum TaxID=2893886 RepID=UPI001E5D1E97|nr:hypothetical protein [Flavobacterium sp. F-340]UFH47408.1 hypothetical protein LNP27_05055 [Flavobacterium sp. F-340]
MKKKSFLNGYPSLLAIITLFFTTITIAQQTNMAPQPENQFWRNVQFGGGLGLGFGSGYTDISIAPSAIYNLNEYAALGLGLQYKYLKQKNYYASHFYGGSIIGLLNPIRQIQLSAELEQLRVNVNLVGSNSNSQDYWNTALFVGAGYRSGNATIGARYNVLDDKNSIYGSAFMPFVRVYF